MFAKKHNTIGDARLSPDIANGKEFVASSVQNINRAKDNDNRHSFGNLNALSQPLDQGSKFEKDQLPHELSNDYSLQSALLPAVMNKTMEGPQSRNSP